MSITGGLQTILVDFINELDREFDDPHVIEQILNGNRTITTRDLGAEPETWTEDVLINPVLNAVGLHKSPGRPSSQRKTPDFKLEEEADGNSAEIVGENKSLNKIDEAEHELVQDYLSNISFSNECSVGSLDSGEIGGIPLGISHLSATCVESSFVS